MAADEYLHFRASPELADDLRRCARISGRSLSGELRAAAQAHVAAVVEALEDDDPGARSQVVEGPPVLAAEHARP